MTEAFLHYLWKHRLFDFMNLKTTAGEPLQIIFPGYHNTDAGPDFRQAIVQIGAMKWAGDVEIHIRSSDWYRHHHQDDEKYLSVALHVVYEHDCEVERRKGELFPTFELKNYIPEEMLAQYQRLMASPEQIPCASYLPGIEPLHLRSLLSSMVMERMLRKQEDVLRMVRECNGDWKETLYRLLAIGFGFKTNVTAFELLAKSLPLKVLAKHADSELQTAALIFGQAGMLERSEVDEYYDALKYEYDYLRCKYQLMPIGEHHWNLLRLRPPNFPCVRLAQLAALMHDSPDLSELCLECPSVETLKRELSVCANPYWENHYHFGQKTILKHSVCLGDTAASLLIINTVVPFRFAHHRFFGNENQLERTLALLEELSFENNKRTREFVHSPFPQQNAMDSQALLELSQYYCSPKRCLECAVGEKIVRNIRL